MNLLDIWAITTIVNFCYRIKTNIQIYKVYADLGYIYNGKLLKNIEDDEAEDDNLLAWFFYKFGKFVPIYNLFQSLARKFSYCIDAKENIEDFEKYGIIEKMTTSEREEYNKNKTGMTAFKMRKRLNKKRKKKEFIFFDDGSSILFDYKYDDIDNEKELLDSIKIIEVRGNLENTSQEKLIRMVYNSHIDMAMDVLNNYDNPDAFLGSYNEKDKVELVTEEKTDQSNLYENNLNNKAKKRVRRK